MPLNDKEYQAAVETVAEVFEKSENQHVDSLGRWGRQNGYVPVRYHTDTPSHLRFVTEVRLNELRRRGFVIVTVDTRGILLQHESCHNPDSYGQVYGDDR